jgi:hypothetical protein
MTAEDFLNTFVRYGYGPYFLILITGFLFGIVRWNQLSKAGRGVWSIIAISFLIESIGSYLLINTLPSNNPSFHLINCLHFAAYGWTFSKFANNPLLARIFLYAGVLLAAYSITNTFLIEGVYNYPTQAISVFNGAMVLGALFTFRDMLKQPSPVSLRRQSVFWFATATLIFYACTFFTYALLSYYGEHGEYLPTWARYLNHGMNYYLYISYIIALWFDSKRSIH